MSLAMAKHILSKDKAESEKLLKMLSEGADFAQLAKKHSNCPSKKNGGDLGEIRKGQLVKPIENIIFKGALKKVHGPIKSQFGYHLVLIYFRQ